eukprot:TRINITY_DN83089_c0_g1_i1.p1 TRINITY_DN83089_c0_g1~~TRINITY_DN83089_c0_g1_i1.p1  ORF type:complete len:296 (+),score=70.32 TRINITY_DN83089_c0_g1_i1:119-1006(+)
MLVQQSLKILLVCAQWYLWTCGALRVDEDGPPEERIEPWEGTSQQKPWVGFAHKVAVVQQNVLDVESDTKQNATDNATNNITDTVIVDPAGLPYIHRYGPKYAPGLSSRIYGWLNISENEAFPKAVQSALTREEMAKLSQYGDKSVIHAICPDLNNKEFTGASITAPNIHGALVSRSVFWDKVVEVLAITYKNIFKEFLKSKLHKLRMEPVSVEPNMIGSFAGQLPDITREAVNFGYARLTAKQKSELLHRQVVMCLPEQKDFKSYEEAMTAVYDPAKQREAEKRLPEGATPAQR